VGLAYVEVVQVISVYVYAGWLRWLGCSGLEQAREWHWLEVFRCICMLSELVYCSKWWWFSKGCVCVACEGCEYVEKSGILLGFSGCGYVCNGYQW